MTKLLRNHPLVGLLLMSLWSGIPCLGQHMNEQDSPCPNAVATSDLVECLSKARVAADAELTSLYRDIRKRLDASQTGRLTAAQRLWIQYRDANCAAERSLYDGGTAAGPVYLACLENMTKSRSKELRVTYAVRLK